MRKHFLIFIFCLATFYSCSPKDKVPTSLIQPEKMGDVIWDVMRMQFLAEEKAAIDTFLKQEDELKRLTEKVFDLHQITAKKFENSYNWYVKHPTFLKRIFDSIQVQKQRIYNENEENPEVMEGVSLPDKVTKGKLERRNKQRMNSVE